MRQRLVDISALQTPRAAAKLVKVLSSTLSQKKSSHKSAYFRTRLDMQVDPWINVFSNKTHGIIQGHYNPNMLVIVHSIYAGIMSCWSYTTVLRSASFDLVRGYDGLKIGTKWSLAVHLIRQLLPDGGSRSTCQPRIFALHFVAKSNEFYIVKAIGLPSPNQRTYLEEKPSPEADRDNHLFLPKFPNVPASKRQFRRITGGSEPKWRDLAFITSRRRLSDVPSSIPARKSAR